jgi:hypothetical protein
VRTSEPKPAEALDTIAGWPPQSVRVLTLEERHAYDILRLAMPRHLVFAQVPLSRFISVPTENAYNVWLQRVGRLNVDLLITDASSRPIAVVEIRSVSESSRSEHRHKRLSEVLQSAGIPVHVWREDKLPTPEEAARALRGELSALEQERNDAADSKDPYRKLATVDEKGRKSLPVAQVEELLAAGDERDFGGHDPVASTFFDEFDVLETRAAR